jgi:hypothetical protein
MYKSFCKGGSTCFPYQLTFDDFLMIMVRWQACSTKENLQTKVKRIQGFQIKCVNENILCVQKRLPYYFNWGSIWARWLGPNEEIDWPQHLSSRLQQCFLFLFLISQSGKLLLIKNLFYTGKTSTFKVFFSNLYLQTRENSPQENQRIPLY